MITVCASQYGIIASGHACYAPDGEDIVCAGFTTLMNTLVETVERMYQDNKLNSKKVEIDKGKAIIMCNPKGEYMYETAIVFTTIKTGIEILENMYPEYILKKF